MPDSGVDRVHGDEQLLLGACGKNVRAGPVKIVAKDWNGLTSLVVDVGHEWLGESGSTRRGKTTGGYCWYYQPKIPYGGRYTLRRLYSVVVKVDDFVYVCVKGGRSGLAWDYLGPDLMVTTLSCRQIIQQIQRENRR